MQTVLRRAVACAAFVLASCATLRAPDAVDRYLHARSLEEASEALAPNYRLYFGDRGGAGVSRADALQMLQWDYALHAEHHIDEVQPGRKGVTVRVHEDNDFSKLLGFPGWDATSTFELDERGLIVSQTYVPKANQPDWRPYLEAPLAWIRVHRPDALNRIYPNGQLAHSPEAAREWVEVLTAWRAAPPLFAMQSNFWINLHHFLRVVARGMPVNVSMTAEERAVWDAAVTAYKPYAQRDLLFDEGMVAIKEALRRASNDAAPVDIPNEPALRATLVSVAPIYRKYWWGAHDALNRSWIAEAQVLVDRYGPRLAQDLAASYGQSWPAASIPVDVSIAAGPNNAYTTREPHTTISSIAKPHHGLTAVELLFHESSHQWGRPLQIAINTAEEKHGKKVPRQLWHAVLFYNAGELTRRAVAKDGVSDYVEYAQAYDVYKDLCGEGCRERVAKAWDAHLDRGVSIEAALDALVAEWPAP